MESIDAAARFVRDPDLIATDMDGDTVMMSIVRGKYFGLDPVGSRVWKLLEQPATLDDMVRVVRAEFDVDEATCKADMASFVGELQSHGLIRPA